jgi:hypothetical protein
MRGAVVCKNSTIRYAVSMTSRAESAGHRVLCGGFSSDLRLAADVL